MQNKFVSIFLLIALSTLSIGTILSFPTEHSGNTLPFLSIIMFTFSLICIGISVYFYIAKNEHKITSHHHSTNFDDKLGDLKDDLEVQITNLGDENMRQEISDIIDRKIEEFSVDSLLGALDKSVISHLLQKSNLKTLRYDFESIKERLDDEIYSLRRISNVNLTIGVLVTVAAVIVLISALFSNETKSLRGLDYLYHILPRISLAVFIELLSFFFLKMYKRRYEEIKFYNNELTNVEQKIISLKVSMLSDSNMLDDVIRIFASSERNYILKKDETTVDIQKLSIETTSSNKIIEALTGILKTK